MLNVTIAGSSQYTLELGFMTSITGESWNGGRTHSGALALAVDVVNAAGWLGQYRLGYKWRDSQCDAGKGLAAMSELLDVGVDAFIGPACSIACEPTQLLASNRGLLQARHDQFVIS